MPHLEAIFFLRRSGWAATAAEFRQIRRRRQPVLDEACGMGRQAGRPRQFLAVMAQQVPAHRPHQLAAAGAGVRFELRPPGGEQHEQQFAMTPQPSRPSRQRVRTGGNSLPETPRRRAAPAIRGPMPFSGIWERNSCSAPRRARICGTPWHRDSAGKHTQQGQHHNRQPNPASIQHAPNAEFFGGSFARLMGSGIQPCSCVSMRLHRFPRLWSDCSARLIQIIRTRPPHKIQARHERPGNHA